MRITKCLLPICAADRAVWPKVRPMRSLAAAFCLLLGGVTTSAVHAQDPIPGSLHTSPFPGFNGGTGKITNLAIGASNDYGTAIALQSDGKIVLVGRCTNSADMDFCVARVSPDGTLDNSFDGPSGVGNGKFLLPIGSGYDAANAVAVQPDGKIVLAGSCSNGAIQEFCVARLNADGTLDTSFDGPSGNGDGKFLLPINPSYNTANAIALQPDGKILLAGMCGSLGGPSRFCASRLHVDGTLDVSFDGPGVAGNGKFELPQIEQFQEAAIAIAVQSDGKILLAGYCYNINAAFAANFCIARLNVDGSFDASFDGPNVTPGNGKFSVDVSTNHDQANAMSLQPDGKILVAGGCSAPSMSFCLTRLNADGSLDSSFDGPSNVGNGKVILPLGGSGETVYAMTLQPDGKIVLAGECVVTSQIYFCMARLNADGSLDASFDSAGIPSNGKFILPLGTGDDNARAVALQTDGKILVAGYCDNGANQDICVARVHGGPFAATQCSLDMDGDGKVQATVDGLISTRVMLGLTGSAVVGGINFAPHATRQTWVEIRNYLVNQCGMKISP